MSARAKIVNNHCQKQIAALTQERDTALREIAEARHEGRMEALNAVFQINGPSRAIARLKEKYAAERAASIHPKEGE